MAASLQKISRVCDLCKRRYFVLSPQARSCHATKSSSSKRARKWQSVVGLEIHAQINTKSKLFSGAENKFGGATNSQVALFDAAFPGTLPVINRSCVEAGVLTALALKCRINKVSKFDRKHYFYADLPAGYQITQQRQPLAVKGHVEYCIKNKNNFENKTVDITQLQLEQDSGKSLHDETERLSLIDLNRCGTGLMEIVTEPDFTNGMDAAAFVRELQQILQTINTCDGKMEEGSLRVDANISVHLPGQPYGIRTEVKNLNSIKSVSKAIDYEVRRQIKILDQGGEIENETRSFDAESEETLPMRDKEVKTDYRFMPEPNLPPLCLFDNDTIQSVSNPSNMINIDDLKLRLSPLPEEIRVRLEQQYNISRSNSMMLVDKPDLMVFFEAVMKSPSRNGKQVSNFIINTFVGLLNERNLTPSECPVSADALGDLMDMLQREEVSHTISVKVALEMLKNPGRTAVDIVKENDWYQVNDETVLETVSQTILKENVNMVAKYYKGKTKHLNKLVEKAVNVSNGNPRLIKKIISEILHKDEK